jgi:hypothetical protein
MKGTRISLGFLNQNGGYIDDKSRGNNFVDYCIGFCQADLNYVKEKVRIKQLSPQ